MGPPCACRSLAAVLWLAVIVAAPRAAAEDVPSLASYVPSNIHSYLHWRSTPAGERLGAPYWKAIVKLKESGIGRDLFDLATLELPAERRAQALAVVERVLGLLGKPRWAELLRSEVTVAFRFALPPEYMVLFRVPEGEASKHRLELREMLSGFREFAPEVLAVNDAARFGAEVSSLAFTGAPIAISVASKRGVVGITTSDILLDEALRLMDAEGGASNALANDPRFRSASEGLASGADSESYLDVAGYMGFIRQMVDLAGGQLGNDPDAAGGLSILKTVCDELARLGTVVAAERAEGDRWIADVRVSFASGGNAGFIEELLRTARPVGDFARAVPKDASSFYVTSGIDWAKVHDGLVRLIRERLPRGPGLLEEWEKIQKEVGFSVRDDLLAWIEGGGGIICLPGRPAGSEFALHLRVRDEEKAKKLVSGAFARAKELLARRGQELALEEEAELGADLRVVRLGVLPRFRPVIGLAGGGLVIASSSDAVRRVRAVYEGKAPGIRENPRFAAVNVPDGPLTDVFYQDVEGSLQGLADLVGILGLLGSVLPEERETKPLIKLGAILTKLSAFVRDLDLNLDSAGWTKFDAEKRILHSRRVVRQRSPGPAAKL